MKGMLGNIPDSQGTIWQSLVSWKRIIVISLLEQVASLRSALLDEYIGRAEAQEAAHGDGEDQPPQGTCYFCGKKRGLRLIQVRNSDGFSFSQSVVRSV